MKQANENQSSRVAGWRLREYPIVDSTNLVASTLDVWEAVRADQQSAGRGRFQRSWVSDKGGLWLSAVVPIDTEGRAGRVLPLVVGLAVCDVLRALGVRSLRMRWPNDLLVGDRKLAGLLIDQFTTGLAVIGIGVNVLNDPEATDPGLRNQTTRLADLVPRPPSVPDLAAMVLRSLRPVMYGSANGNFPTLLPRVNELWGRPRRVELDLDGETQGGVFRGVDEDGRLILSDDSGNRVTYDSWQVHHLKEID
jgi:BirA family transcriptional regulator, biotin operon repressor / biotin---[acetyl-CoA-carboxylase] ligase